MFLLLRKVNFGAPVFYQNVNSPVALQTFPPSDTLYSGTHIAQLSKLFSANGQYLLTPENQGNVALYTFAGGFVWSTATYPNTGGPFTLYMQTVCCL